MMKIRQLAMGAAVILLTTGSPHAWSHDSPDSKFHNWKHSWSHGWARVKPHSGWFYGKKGTGFSIGKNQFSQSETTHDVPEIDAASGTSALALLAGVLLLAGERSRSKRR
jgi:hypothetical protein